MSSDISKDQRAQTIFAPAKVNLALHITGQRDDGYHLLDSLVAFPQIGDHLHATPASGGNEAHLRISGPFASDLASADGADNLVTRAFNGYFEALGRPAPDIDLILEKHLPVASGIGGGSSDASAALRLAEDLTHGALDRQALHDLALRLGADVPVCLEGKPVRMSGIGDILSPVPELPEFGIVLVNPRVGVSTPAIFRRLTERNNTPLPSFPPAFACLEDMTEWLLEARNDMQTTAETLCPAISQVIESLESDPACTLARMSGSGATCFALTRPEDAESLADRLKAVRPEWWIAAAQV